MPCLTGRDPSGNVGGVNKKGLGMLPGVVPFPPDFAARYRAKGYWQDKSLADHLSHLIVHGVLHLLGHDHGTDAEAAAMEMLETSILASLGVADPYRGTM